MLKLFKELSPFIENCYSEFGVREYSRILKITAPTGSKMLKIFFSEGLLNKREERGNLLFRANRDSGIFLDISRSYWKQKLNELIYYLNSELYTPAIILFGSLSNLETKKDSDIDLMVLTNLKKKINLKEFERNLGRKVQLFLFKSLSSIPKNLKNSAINGYLIQGELK